MKLLATALLALLAVAVAQDQPTLGDCRDIKLVDGGYTVEAKCGDGDDTTKLDLKPCILINNGLMMWDHFDKYVPPSP
ncbi:hypothetical protein IMZ48_25655, partial [Candidatus Bathyarchaeota archaeon]|nr:hypothetical protein [Candidatus Bathyarchaeota archaeon]